MAPSRQCNGTTGMEYYLAASRDEAKEDSGPEQDHSRTESERSRSWAGCRDKNPLAFEPQGKYFS
jgi:hypothetical protein